MNQQAKVLRAGVCTWDFGPAMDMQRIAASGKSRMTIVQESVTIRSVAAMAEEIVGATERKLVSLVI